MHAGKSHSPYINHFIQPDTIIPDQANPQSWNRYSYVLNRPTGLSDPTGHCYVGGHEMPDSSPACQWSSSNQGSLVGNGNGGFVGSALNPEEELEKNKDKEKNKDRRKPGEPLCTAEFVCDVLNRSLAVGAWMLDGAGLFVSGLEAGLADIVYVGAAIACVATEFVACGPIFELAFGLDVAIAAAGGFVENGLGYASASLTILGDVSAGNIGYDQEIGVYVGRDSLVSVRNSLAGSINESNLDLLVSLSQWDYDMDRINGKKSGGYVPLLSWDAAKQFLFEDWW